MCVLAAPGVSGTCESALDSPLTKSAFAASLLPSKPSSSRGAQIRGSEPLSAEREEAAQGQGLAAHWAPGPRSCETLRVPAPPSERAPVSSNVPEKSSSRQLPLLTHPWGTSPSGCEQQWAVIPRGYSRGAGVLYDKQHIASVVFLPSVFSHRMILAPQLRTRLNSPAVLCLLLATLGDIWPSVCEVCRAQPIGFLALGECVSFWALSSLKGY